MKRDHAIRRAIDFLTNSDGLGFGTQEMGGERFYVEADKVVAELRAALASPHSPLQDRDGEVNRG